MTKFAVYCEGVTPLLMNQFVAENIENQSVEERLYRDEHGEIAYPVLNFYKSLENAGRKVHNGKHLITQASGNTSLYAFLIIEGGCHLALVTREGIDIFLPSLDWHPLTIKIQSKNIVVPCFEQWGLRPILELDEAHASEATLRQLLEVAGSEVGLGEARNKNQGGYGHFRIAEWEEQEEIEAPPGMRYIPPPS